MVGRWFSNFRVFLTWLVGFGLTLAILALLHELFVVFIVNTLHWEKYTVRFSGMFYYFPAGLFAIAYMVLVYAYLNNSVRKGTLLRSSMLVIGILLLLLGLVQIGLVAYGYYSAGPLFAVLIIGEVTVGVVLLILAIIRLPNMIHN